MFGKKLLSVVGLLFLGSQIISVEAGCTPSISGNTCTPNDCESVTDGTFFKVEEGENVYIVEVNSDGTPAGTSCSIRTDKNFCVDESNNIMTMVDSFCNDIQCDKMYGCDGNGVCKEDKNPRSCQNVSCKWDATNGFTGCSDGDYLIVEETKEEPHVAVGLIEGGIKDSVSNNAKLYSCSKPSEEPHSKRDNVVKCEAVKGSIAVGYYKNAGSVNYPYIQCDDKNGCSSVAPQKGSCSNSIIGDLFIENEVVKICLDDGISLALEDNEDVEGKYFMKTKVGDDNVFKEYFGSVVDSFVALDVQAKDVQAKEIHLSFKGQVISMYRFTNENHKIFEKDDRAKICMNNNRIVEFKLNSCSTSDVEYYSKSGDQLYNGQQQAAGAGEQLPGK